MFLITLEDKYILLAMEMNIYFDVVTSTGTLCVDNFFFFEIFLKERGSVLRETLILFFFSKPCCYFLAFKFKHIIHHEDNFEKNFM